MTENMTASHGTKVDQTLIDLVSPGLLIVSPPRSGSGFAHVNMTKSLKSLSGPDGVEVGSPDIFATNAVSALTSSTNIVSIVRNPSDWITSLVAQRAFLEGRSDFSNLLDEEISAAAVALQKYKDFNSNSIIFVKFEDVVFKFFRTLRVIAGQFGYALKDSLPKVVLRQGTVLSPKTSRNIAFYPQIVEAIKTKDLTTVNGLYQDLLAKTVTV